MAADRCLNRILFLIAQLPKLDFVVIAASDESLGRRLELLTIFSRHGVFREYRWLGGGTPTNTVDSGLVSDEIIGFDPLIVFTSDENHQLTFSSTCRQNQTILPGCP